MIWKDNQVLIKQDSSTRKVSSCNLTKWLLEWDWTSSPFSLQLKSDEADFKNTSAFSQHKILHLGAIQYFNFSQEIHIVRYRQATLYFTIYSSSNVSVNLQS